MIAYALLTRIDLHPIVAGLIILSEGLLYYAFAMGMFANDYLWFWKSWFPEEGPDCLNDHRQLVRQSKHSFGNDIQLYLIGSAIDGHCSVSEPASC